MKRLAASLAVTWVAAMAGLALGRPAPATSSWYLQASTILLAIGLFASTSSIHLASLAQRLGSLLVAVSVGVLAKAAAISAVMVAVFRVPESLLLGLAVAQIDPLSVSALSRRGSLSARGRSFLAAWASFDDPVTVLLTLSLSAAVLSRTGSAGGGLSAGLAGGGAGGFALRLLGNLALAGVLWACWEALRRSRPLGRRDSPRARRAELVVDSAEIVLLLGALAAAVAWSLLFGLAVSGLFLRPRLLQRPRGERAREIVVDIAFYLAVVLLGLTLTRGVQLVPGVVLGVAAFFAQALVAPAIAWKAERGDRIRLAFAQQNGITAILLGLTLEPAFPGALGTIAPAILVVNVLHLGSKSLLDRLLPVSAEDERPELVTVENPVCAG